MVLIRSFRFFQEKKSGKIGEENKNTANKNKSFAYFFSGGEIEQKDKSCKRRNRKYKVKKRMEKSCIMFLAKKKVRREKFVK